MPKVIYDQSISKQDRRTYSNTKAQAAYRGEEWAFTIETWLDMWETSGFKEHRGRQPHQYCMVRLDPIEAWGPHNCIIVARRMLLKKTCYEAMLGLPKSNWQARHDVRKQPWDTIQN